MYTYVIRSYTACPIHSLLRTVLDIFQASMEMTAVAEVARKSVYSRRTQVYILIKLKENLFVYFFGDFQSRYRNATQTHERHIHTETSKNKLQSIKA